MEVNRNQDFLNYIYGLKNCLIKNQLNKNYLLSDKIKNKIIRLLQKV